MVGTYKWHLEFYIIANDENMPNLYIWGPNITTLSSSLKFKKRQ